MIFTPNSTIHQPWLERLPSTATSSITKIEHAGSRQAQALSNQSQSVKLIEYKHKSNDAQQREHPLGRHPVPIAVLRPIAMSRLLTDSLFSAERGASNATEARYGALLSFEKQPRPSKSAAEESQLLCFYYFYRVQPMEHLQQGPVCADALVPHTHT